MTKNKGNISGAAQKEKMAVKDKMDDLNAKVESITLDAGQNEQGETPNSLSQPIAIPPPKKMEPGQGPGNQSTKGPKSHANRHQRNGKHGPPSRSGTSLEHPAKEGNAKSPVAHGKAAVSPTNQRPMKKAGSCPKSSNYDENWHVVHHGHLHASPTSAQHHNTSPTNAQNHHGSPAIAQPHMLAVNTQQSQPKNLSQSYHGRPISPRFERSRGHVGSYEGRRHGMSNMAKCPAGSWHQDTRTNHTSPRDNGDCRSPLVTAREQAFASCRRALVAGDAPEVLREVLGNRLIESCNKYGFFGRSGSEGQTLLMVCSKYGRMECLRTLLDDYAAEVNLQGGLGHFTALHYAAWHGHLDAVKLLLERGANWSLTNDDGETAEGSALANHNTAVAEFIRAWAANPPVPIKETQPGLKENLVAEAVKEREIAVKGQSKTPPRYGQDAVHRAHASRSKPVTVISSPAHVTVGFAPTNQG